MATKHFKLFNQRPMKRFIFLISVLFFYLFSNAQNKFTVSGYITDENGESLIGANVVIAELIKGTVTNGYGFYSLTIPAGEYKLQISYMGYQMQEKKINLIENQKLSFALKEESELIEAVEVTAEKRDANIRNVTMSTEKLDIKTIKKIPTFMGEADIIKAIQLQPGVSVIGEGTSGFYVRGGAVDQNLILLDEAIVYNPAHFGGFFSVFNSDAIKTVELYKGGIPAKFGGRQASVLDVQMRDGSTEKISGKGGIGTLSSRLTLELPVVKSKGSVLLSGRRTYYDVFFPLLNDPVVKDSKVYFWDFNIKANYRLNDKNRLYLSLYSGKDIMQFGKMFKIGYGNATGTLRLNHIFSDKLFSNYMFIGSKYNYSLGQPTGGFAFDWSSEINDFSFKNDYTYFLNPNNTVEFGLQIIYHKMYPGKFVPLGESSFNPSEIPSEYSYESAFYVSNNQKISSTLSVNYGMRINLFNNAGGIKNSYNNEGEFLSKKEYKQGEIFNTFNAIEPRIGVCYIINDKSSLKTNYNRTVQYLHLATNTQAPTPFDIWFTSNSNIKPQYTDQVAIGYFRNFLNDQMEFSLEAYYKILNNAIDFKDHATVFGNERLDGEILQGKGYAYGSEIYLRKKYGNLTGWISYTWSLTRRKIDGINKNKEYPTTYDRPNDIKVVLSYDVIKRLNLSANWVYYTAMPFTVATSYSRYNNAYYPNYSDRNSFRFPGTDYHRLDISATWDFNKLGKTKLYNHSITVSVYNAYNRHNLYSVIYVDDPNTVSGIGLEKLYLFKTIPAVTYNFSF